MHPKDCTQGKTCRKRETHPMPFPPCRDPLPLLLPLVIMQGQCTCSLGFFRIALYGNRQPAATQDPSNSPHQGQGLSLLIRCPWILKAQLLRTVRAHQSKNPLHTGSQGGLLTKPYWPEHTIFGRHKSKRLRHITYFSSFTYSPIFSGGYY